MKALAGLVTVDLTRCCSFAACLEAAPDLFTLRDQDGLVAIVDGAVTAPDSAELTAAIAACPTEAISRVPNP